MGKDHRDTGGFKNEIEKIEIKYCISCSERLQKVCVDFEWSVNYHVVRTALCVYQQHGFAN